MMASRSITRTALQAARCTARRSYATADRPSLAQGGNNRNAIIGLTGISATGLAYFFMREKSPSTADTAPIVSNPDSIRLPDQNPRAPKTRDERQREGQHPEDLDDKYRANFGVVHARKRVDGPPSDRNHEALAELSKQNAKR